MSIQTIEEKAERERKEAMKLAGSISEKTKLTIEKITRSMDLQKRSIHTKRVVLCRANIFLKWLKENGIKLEKVDENIHGRYLQYANDKYAPSSFEMIKHTSNLILTRLHGKKPDWIARSKENGGEFCCKSPQKFVKKKEILTPEEIQKMVMAGENLLEKTLVMALFESGARQSEFLNIKREDVEHDEYGCIVKVTGKTGTRNIRLIDSAPFIREIEKKHKNKCPEASLWQFDSGIARARGSVIHTIGRVAKRASIEKKVTYHVFRHSRATDLAPKLTEAQLCTHFGWEIGSKMPRTYIDRQAIDTSMALLRERGILVGKDKKKALENPLESRKCPHCMTRNLASDKFCHDCGRALEDNLDNAISNIKMVMNEMDSEEFRKFMELWDIMKGRNTEKPLSR